MATRATRQLDGFGSMGASCALIVALCARAHAEDIALVAASPPRPALPSLGFIENAGQYEPGVRFVAHAQGAVAFLTDTDIRFVMDGGDAVFLRFDHALATAQLEAEHVLPGKHHFFLGNDPSKWVRDARSYESVVYRDLYPNVDLRAYLKGGAFEYDLVVRPGGDLDSIDLRLDGVESVAIRENGSIRFRTRCGEFEQSNVHAFATSPDSSERPIRVRVCGDSDGNLMFESASERESNTLLTVDPQLVFSTYLGWSNSSDLPIDSIVTIDGSILMVGRLGSPEFPITPGAYTTGFVNISDAIVMRISADGSSIEYSTVIGGIGADSASSIRQLPGGRMIVAGGTEALDFPVTPNAFQGARAGFVDAFLLQLSADGSALLGSTYFGAAGNNSDVPQGSFDVDAQERCYFAGEVITNTLPTTPGALIPSYQGSTDVFLAVLSSDCTTLDLCTYIGGPQAEYGPSLALDDSGGIYISGMCLFGQFPVTSGAFDTTYAGGIDYFVIKLKPMAQGVRYATYLGGVNSEEFGRLAVTADGKAIVACVTNSSDFPSTPNSFDPSFDGIGSAVIAELNTQGSALLYSGFLHNDIGQLVHDLAVDPAGGLYFTGDKKGPIGFPATPDAFDPTPNGASNAVLARIDPTGSSVVYGTWLGGSKIEQGYTVAVNANRRVVVAGLTMSPDFPVTPGVIQPNLFIGCCGIDEDMFITTFDLCNGKFSTYGSGCPGSPLGASQTPTLTGTGCPAAGGSVTLTLSNALAGAPAALLLGTGQGSLSLNGSCALQIAPLLPSFILPLVIPAGGSLPLTAELPVPLPKVTLYLQALVGDPAAAGGIASSAPVRMEIGD